MFIPLLAFILLAVNLILAPHNPYQEKNSTFECGYHSWLGQNRTQFSISFFIFALLFLLFDLEILLIYPYALSAYTNEVYGLIIMLVFFLLLTLGFAFELGKNALKIDSRQMINLIPIEKMRILATNVINIYFNIVLFIDNILDLLDLFPDSGVEIPDELLDELAWGYLDDPVMDSDFGLDSGIGVTVLGVNKKSPSSDLEDSNNDNLESIDEIDNSNNNIEPNPSNDDDDDDGNKNKDKSNSSEEKKSKVSKTKLSEDKDNESEEESKPKKDKGKGKSDFNDDYKPEEEFETQAEYLARIREDCLREDQAEADLANIEGLLSSAQVAAIAERHEARLEWLEAILTNPNAIPNIPDMDTLCNKYIEEEIRFNEEQRKRLLEENRMENSSSENLPQVEDNISENQPVEDNNPQSVQSTIAVNTSAPHQSPDTNTTTNLQTERVESPTIAGPSRGYWWENLDSQNRPQEPWGDEDDFEDEKKGTKTGEHSREWSYYSSEIHSEDDDILKAKKLSLLDQDNRERAEKELRDKLVSAFKEQEAAYANLDSDTYATLDPETREEIRKANDSYNSTVNSDYKRKREDDSDSDLPESKHYKE
jgi:NADH-ubiquinone oxidoreductase chain 3